MIPYQVAKDNKIIVIDEPLGNIDGYYKKVDGIKFIHVNSDLNEWYKSFVVAHQLYFALNDIDYKFLIKNNYEIDYDAKRFALDMIQVKEGIKEHGSFSALCKSRGIMDDEHIKVLEERMNKIYGKQ